MKIALFYHSIYSDWNHGNAHFLRGVMHELLKRGHVVQVFEPEDSWSRMNLVKDHGDRAIHEFRERFPQLSAKLYHVPSFDPVKELEGFEAVIVHEWNDPRLAVAIGRAKEHCGFMLFFHDTHHRAVSDPKSLVKFNLSAFDGVLAFGDVIKNIYLEKKWCANGWTWHEAADVNIFYPRSQEKKEGDLVWIGNWGDGERKEELREFLIEPVRELGLKAKVYGVRYPGKAKKLLSDAGIEYGGWLPNYKVPEVFSRYKVTVHVPRRPYVQMLPGIPTIRPFEALACGIPLVCSPWRDAEHLFTPGADYLVANDKNEMKEYLSTILNDPDFAQGLSAHGLNTLREKHTCGRRVDQLENIIEQTRKNQTHSQYTGIV